jgi:hypothetical protein
MLPYRLRPSVYGSRLRKIKEQLQQQQQRPAGSAVVAQGASTTYRNGGPLEEAIQTDLRALWPIYQTQLLKSAENAVTSAVTNRGNGELGFQSVSTNTTKAITTLSQNPTTGRDDFQAQAGLCRGRAFGAFRHVFAATKVAALFRNGSGGQGIEPGAFDTGSRNGSTTTDNAAPVATTNDSDTHSSDRCIRGLLPQRCDRNAYSQLVYSASLALLQEFCCDKNHQPTSVIAINGQTADNDAWLMRVSYAVFLLYALYQTNPLPVYWPTKHTQGDASEVLSLLPMGLQDRQNPKVLYRHAYKSPVRIDGKHYGYLLQIGQWAKMVLDQCEAAWIQHQRDDHRAPLPNQWKISVAVALDLTIVLGRIHTTNMLEFCSYTGPCGLEGLAGHRDYPYPAGGEERPPAAHGQTANAPANHSAEANASSLPASDTDSPLTYSNALQESLQHYHTCRQSIRLPKTPNQSTSLLKVKRVRDALAPMFDHTLVNGTDAVSSLLELCGGREMKAQPPVPPKRIKLRHGHVWLSATATTNENETRKQLDDGSIPEREDETVVLPGQAVQRGTDHEDDAIELTLPDGLDMGLKQSLQAAVQMLLNRNIALLPTLAHCSPGNGALSRTDDNVTGLSALEHDGDDENDKVSVAQLSQRTTRSGVGRSALQDLLAKAHPCKTGLSRVHDNFSFLESTSTKMTEASMVAKAGKDDEDVEFCSDLSSDDDVSVALSHVGRRALQALLDTTVRLQGKPSRRGNEKQSPRGSHKRATVPRLQSRSKHDKKHSSAELASRLDVSTEEDALYNPLDSSDDRSDSSKESCTTNATQGQGRSALAALLASAKQC